MRINDDSAFFEAYAQMPEQGLSAAGERRQLEGPFPEATGKAVSELGCGYGGHGRDAAERGAARATGDDRSPRMIDEALRRNADDRNDDQGRMIIRRATKDDARQIAEILVEDWQKAYSGIIDRAYLDSMSVEQRYQRELQRYQQYTVAADDKEVLGFAWNETADDEAADCEIVALYVRYGQRKSGIGRALFQNSADAFRASGRRRMIVWCLKENMEARRFYEKMGGAVYKAGTHPWGDRDYDMIAYLYRLDEG